MEIKDIKINRNSFMGKSEVIRSASALLDKRVNIIYGRPGTGKTTLLEGVAGLEKIVSGSVLYSGPVFFLMQIPEKGFIYSSCRQEIAGAGNLNARDREYLDILGITEDLLAVSPWNLSKGEKKKLALAGILKKARGKNKEDVILVMDDPFADLDAEGRNCFLKLVFNNKDDFSKIIMSTADTADILFLEDAGTGYRRFNLEGGQLVEPKNI